MISQVNENTIKLQFTAQIKGELKHAIDSKQENPEKLHLSILGSHCYYLEIYRNLK